MISHVYRHVALSRCSVRLALGVGAAAAAMLMAAPVASAAPGDLDTSFGTNGTTLTAVGSHGDGADSMVRQSDGKLVVAGTGTDSGGTLQVQLARYNSDGSLDTTYGANHTGIVTLPKENGNVLYPPNLALQPSTGDVIVAGTWTPSPGTSGDFGALRLDTSGNVDPSFNAGAGFVDTPVGSGGTASAVAVASSGETYVGGSATPSGGGSERDLAVVAYTAGGSLDTNFNGTGEALTPVPAGNGEILGLALDGSNLVAAGDDFDSTSGNPSIAVMRYTPTGGDSTFNGGQPKTFNVGTDPYAHSVLVQPGHKIVVGGVGGYSGVFCMVLGRLNGDGSQDTSFGSNGDAHDCLGTSNGDDSEAYGLASDGTYIYAGGNSFINSTGHNHFALARFSLDGVLDTSFGSSGSVTTDPAGPGNDSNANAIVLDANGNPLIAGQAFNTTSSTTYFALERFLGGSASSGGSGGSGGSGSGSGGSGSGSGGSGSGSGPASGGSGSAGGPPPPPPPPPPAVVKGSEPYLGTAIYPTLAAFGPYVEEFNGEAVGNAGKWTGNPTNYVFEWLRCAQIPPANSNQGCQVEQNDDLPASTHTDAYKISAADRGNYLVLEVKGVNAGGYTIALSSAAKVGLPPSNVEAPNQTGQGFVGAILTGDAGSWAGQPIVHYEYVWHRCHADGSNCQTIAQDSPQVAAIFFDGAPTYKLTKADIGHRLWLEVIGHNASGSSSKFARTISGVIQLPPTPVGQAPAQGNPATGGAPDNGANGQTGDISGGLYVPPGGGASTGGGAIESPNNPPPGNPRCWLWVGNRWAANPACVDELPSGLEPTGPGASLPPFVAHTSATRHQAKAKSHHGKAKPLPLLGTVTLKHLNPGANYLQIKITPRVRKQLMPFAHHGVIRVKVVFWVIWGTGKSAKTHLRISTVTVHLLPTKHQRKHHATKPGRKHSH